MGVTALEGDDLVNVREIAERQSYIIGEKPEDLEVLLTSLGVGIIEREWDDE